MELQVTRIRNETPSIKAFELAAPDGSELPPFTAGAHIDVDVDLPDGSRGRRSYSLASDPADPSRYEIAVLHLPEGHGGSAYMHSQVSEGQMLSCSQPVNEFPLSENADEHVLVAGGVGITPILAMTHALRSRGADFQLHYAARTEDHMAFRELARQLAGDGFHAYFTQSPNPNPMDLANLLGEPRSGRHAYVCGPSRLMKAVIATAQKLGWSDDQVHRESFGARSEPSDRAIEVELALSGMIVRVEPGTTILHALINAGAFVSYECKRGECGTCQARVLEGEPIHRDVSLTERQRNEDKLMCTCVSWSRTERLVLEA
ncbi:MAG: PDR/VanB family oxidoreductase [Pseudomonadota bacterium]|nr:PDR/VanB family oxidoreductase [Pseudomonadota bacterium]